MDSAGKRPYVLLNMAMSADGKVATANRAVTSFGSARDQHHLLELRATADAVLCGAGTVNEAGITLGVGGARYERRRKSRGLAPTNLRIVVSGRARLRSSADLFREPGGPILILTSRAAPAARVAGLRRRAQGVVRFGRDAVDLGAALRWLRREWGVRRLVCEGGPELNDAMFRAGLVDEVHVTLCPKVFGGRRAPTLVEGRGWARLAQAQRLQLRSVRAIRGELFLVYRASAGASRPEGSC